MRASKIIILSILTTLLFSCKEKSEKTLASLKVENLDPNVNFNEMKSDFVKWWTFYKKKAFEYKVVPNQADFIGEKLNLQAYPTHIIVDENGQL